MASSPLPESPPDPLQDLDASLDWFRRAQLPPSLGGGGAQAHLFTINGLTYPFVRHYNFAAVPDPFRDRQYDMYSGLHLARPGDLLFFFQSDPQAPSAGIDSRRGIRGVYRVTGRPFRAAGPVTDEVTPIGYRLLDRCPNPDCGTPHVKRFRDTKCFRCGEPYPRVTLSDGSQRAAKIINSCLPIEPVIAFERSVSDERVFGDLSMDSLIWVGRHDNAMGPGKGSSIRHLLPEEAVSLVELLATEPGQRVGEASDRRPERGGPIRHEEGPPISMLPTDGRGRVDREDELYFLITEQLFEPRSNLRQALDPHLPDDIGWADLEYTSSTFPWGYTAGEADYVLFFRTDAGRRSLVLVECKRRRPHDRAVLQAALYAERITQVAFLMAQPDAFPPDGRPVEILPVVVAEDAKRPRQDDPRVAIPEPFSFDRSYFGGAEISARVRSPLFLRYLPPDRPEGAPEGYRPVQDYDFEPLDGSRTGRIEWRPHRGAVGTATEMTWILRNTWADARAAETM